METEKYGEIKVPLGKASLSLKLNYTYEWQSHRSVDEFAV